MHARIDGGQVKLLTRSGLDWSHRYRRTIKAPGALKVDSAYLDGELCALNADGVPTSGANGGRAFAQGAISVASSQLAVESLSSSGWPPTLIRSRLITPFSPGAFSDLGVRGPIVERMLP